MENEKTKYISKAFKTDSNPKMLLKKFCKLTKFDDNIS